MVDAWVRRGAFAVGCIAISISFSRESFAFCRTTACSTNCTTDEDGCPSKGPKLYWASGCVGFSVQKNGTSQLLIDDVRVAVLNSFYAWTDVTCDGGKATMAFSELPDVTCNKAEYNPKGQNANVIAFRDNGWTYINLDNTLAKTTVSFDSNTGEILDADVEINSAFNEFTLTDTNVDYDLESILTHEIGHFIGLAHSPDPEALMFASYREHSIARALAADDVAALCETYPPTRKANCSTVPRGGFTAECSSQSSGCNVAETGENSSAGWGVPTFLGFLIASRALKKRKRASDDAEALALALR